LRYKGKIKELNHIVISDPTYGEDVWCRYEKNNINQKNWKVDIDIHQVEDKFEEITIKGTEFFLCMYRNSRVCQLENEGTIKTLKGVKISKTEIGMDTACVALGINDKAKDIIESQEEWQPECSLNTLTDGIFGTVKEGKMGNNIVFIWVSGYLCEDTGYSMDDIIDYLQYQLNITELEKDLQRPYIIEQEETLEKMHNIALKFKEITKEDPKLLNFFNKDNRFSNISFAGTYLSGIAVRNEQRKSGNLEGEIEKSPYSKQQEKLIEEYTNLQAEFEKTENELENELDM